MALHLANYRLGHPCCIVSRAVIDDNQLGGWQGLRVHAQYRIADKSAGIMGRDNDAETIMVT